MSLALVRMIKDLQGQIDRLEARVRELENIKPVTIPPREKLSLKKA